MSDLEDKKITIKEIAQIAKVSPSTVSMVINNKPGVAVETRAHVLRIVEAFNFTPNLVARSLVKQRSSAVAMLVTTIQNVIYPIIVAGAESVFEECGYALSIFSTHEEKNLESKEIETIRARGFDGVLHAAALLDNQNSEILANSGTPTVWVLRRYPRIANADYVILDDRKAGYLIMEHLIRLGHKRIGVIRGPDNTFSGQERFEGVIAAMRDYRVGISADFIRQGDYLRQSGYHAARSFTAMGPGDRPTAICAANDHMAIGAFDALLEAQLKVPEDIALAGTDNVEASSFRAMEITTVKAHRREMGRLGATRLVDKMEKRRGFRRSFQVVLEPELVIRRSCGYHLSGGYILNEVRRGGIGGIP